MNKPTKTQIDYLCAEHKVWYFRGLYSLLEENEVRAEDYLIRRTGLDQGIVVRYLQKYLDWMFHDIEHPGEIEMSQYIYDNW